jgi:pyruvate,water dikinase
MPTAQTSTYIVELVTAQALDPSIVGSKAASVASLIEIGAIVPPGFAIRADAFTKFIEPVSARIADILASVETENPASTFEAAEAITRLLARQPTPPDLISSMDSRINTPNTRFAVRSSATVEDLEGASFAGMYDTFLDATDAASVLRRIRDVWSSYYTGRAISYRRHSAIPHDSGSMAVLVMELIDADAGGVVFTRDPRDGTDQILINAAIGLDRSCASPGRQTQHPGANQQSTPRRRKSRHHDKKRSR